MTIEELRSKAIAKVDFKTQNRNCSASQLYPTSDTTDGYCPDCEECEGNP